MFSSLDNAGIFLVKTLFDLYLFVLVLRLILVFVRADYFNPLSQLVVKLTNRIITPLRRIIPNVATIELSTLFVIIVVEIIKFTIISFLVTNSVNILGVIILAILDTLRTILSTFFYAILIQALLSWIQPGTSPITQVLNKITSPIIRPIQRILPPVAGFDLSPIPALIGLQVLIILLS